jgi:hypothetical protein
VKVPITEENVVRDRKVLRGIPTHVNANASRARAAGTGGVSTNTGPRADDLGDHPASSPRTIAEDP